MKKNKLISLLVCLVVIFASIPVSAAGISLKINDEETLLSSASTLSNESIMMPLRDMAEKLDFKVVWDENNGRVNLIKVDDVIYVYVDSNEFVMGGKTYFLPCNTVLYGSKTYSPLALFQEIAPIDINWDYDKMTLALTSDAFPDKDGIFSEPPLSAQDLQQPYFTDFSDPYDVYKITVSGNPTADNFIGKSEYKAGWYHDGAKVEALGGSAAYLSWNWYFKLPDFFKGFKAGKYTIRFKVRSQSNITSKTGDYLSFYVGDVANSVKSGSSVHRFDKYNLVNIEDTEWTQFEFVLDYNGESSECPEGIDKDALILCFYASNLGGWYGIDDVEILPVS